MSEPVRTGAHLLVDTLIAHGVRHVFALPGLQLDPLFVALYDAHDRIRVVHTRHEQATSYMADGYARSTGRLGVCAVVPGPGLLNALSGLATAYGTCSPVLCVSGQVPSNLVNSGLGALHEIDDQLAMLGPVTRYAARVLNADDIGTTVREAVRRARYGGPPGPVEIEVPPDVLAAPTAAEVPEPAAYVPTPPDPERIAAAADLLAGACAPVLIAGGGVTGAGAAAVLQELAELLGAPVLLTPNGKGTLSDRHPLAFTLRSAKALLGAADAVVAVGTRLGQWLLGPALDPKTPMVRIDVDPAQLARRIPATVPIVSDAHAGLTALLDALRKRSLPTRRWTSHELAALREAAAGEIAALRPQAEFGYAIREAIPPDAIVVNETTQVGVWCSLGLPVYAPRTLLGSGYMGTLGSGFPTALGAKIGNPDRVVVSLNGDGGFMYNVGELSTMADHRIGVVAIVFNDNAYGNVRRIQLEKYDGRVLASDLQNPDFVRLAEAFGVRGYRAETPESLASTIRKAVADDAPALIEVPVGPMPSPGPLLGWPQ